MTGRDPRTADDRSRVVRGARIGRDRDGARLLPAAVRRRPHGTATVRRRPGRDGRQFAAELAALVEAISAYPGFAARVAELGAKHAGYGVGARHYQVAREALIGALAGRLAGQWNAEVEAAWRRAYNLVAELMMASAASEHR